MEDPVHDQMVVLAIVEVCLEDILVEGQCKGHDGEYLVEPVVRSSAVHVDYLDNLDVACIVLENLDVQDWWTFLVEMHEVMLLVLGGFGDP